MNAAVNNRFAGVTVLIVGGVVIGMLAGSSHSHQTVLLTITLTALLLGLGLVTTAWVGVQSKKAQVAINGDDQYRTLAEEYRRLADLAITAQEHTDLRMGDVSVRIDEMRDRLESVQRILKEVE